MRLSKLRHHILRFVGLSWVIRLPFVRSPLQFGDRRIVFDIPQFDILQIMARGPFSLSTLITFLLLPARNAPLHTLVADQFRIKPRFTENG